MVFLRLLVELVEPFYGAPTGKIGEIRTVLLVARGRFEFG